MLLHNYVYLKLLIYICAREEGIFYLEPLADPTAYKKKTLMTFILLIFITNFALNFFQRIIVIAYYNMPRLIFSNLKNSGEQVEWQIRYILYFHHFRP